MLSSGRRRYFGGETLEYALIGVLIVVAAIAVIGSVRNRLRTPPPAAPTTASLHYEEELAKANAFFWTVPPAKPTTKSTTMGATTRSR